MADSNASPQELQVSSTSTTFDESHVEIRELDDRVCILDSLAKVQSDVPTSERIAALVTDVAHGDRRAAAELEAIVFARGQNEADSSGKLFRIHNASFELGGRDVSSSYSSGELRRALLSTNRRRCPRLPVRGFTRLSALGRTPFSLRDVGPDGMQVELPTETGLRAGAYGSAQLEFGDRVFDGYARVRRWHQGARATLVGLELEPRDQQNAFTRALVEHAFPSMIPRRRVPAEDVMRLIDRAGYSKLTNRTAPNGWHGFESPNSFDFVYGASNGDPIAHVSLTRTFETTWVYHQFASLNGHRDTFAARYDIYKIMAQLPLLMDGPRACAMAYFDPLLPWHGRYFFTFKRWMDQTGDVDIDLADRFTVQVDAAPSEPAWGIEVGPMRADERHVCLEIALHNWTPLVARALDVSMDRLRAPDLTMGTDPALERAREVFVVRRDGAVAAIALAERGASSMSLFGLFNIVHILPGPGLGVRPEQYRSLIDRVRGWYRKAGIKEFILTAPPRALEASQHSSIEFVETMGRFVLNARGLRHYENFVHYMFGEYNLAMTNRRMQNAN